MDGGVVEVAAGSETVGQGKEVLVTVMKYGMPWGKMQRTAAAAEALSESSWTTSYYSASAASMIQGSHRCEET